MEISDRERLAMLEERIINIDKKLDLIAKNLGSILENHERRIRTTEEKIHRAEGALSLVKYTIVALGGSLIAVIFHTLR